MEHSWTPGNKKQVQRTRSGGAAELDDLLGDLLDDDVPVKKKTYSTPATKNQGAKKSSLRDEDFYSNLAAGAEDDLSDVSEADVGQMAKSIADLEDMDADLFGGSIKKKGSIKGERSSKTSTPRRGSTPRARSTTPRTGSPQARVTSPTGKSGASGRGMSPSNRVSSPTRSDTPTTPTRTGSGKRRTAAAADSFALSPTPVIADVKPSTAPGKSTDISSASESLKPNSDVQKRPGTVPKVKQYDFGEFNEDDPLAGLLSDEDEESISAKPKKPALKKTKSNEDTASPVETEDLKQKNFFERPPTRSGSNKLVDPSAVDSPRHKPMKTEISATDSPRHRPVQPPPPPVKADEPVTAKKHEDGGIFSDDDDFLGGLGIDEKPSQPTPTPKAQKTKKDLFDSDDEDISEEKPAKSIMDKLLSSSVSKHLETKEKKEFVLDKKYTKAAKDDEEEDFGFGAYQPSVVSATSNAGSRPSSKRSVRFQDEDDIFGVSERPVSRGRSPASKKSDDLDWLNETINSKVAESKKMAESSKKTEEPVNETKNIPANKTVHVDDESETKGAFIAPKPSLKSEEKTPEKLSTPRGQADSTEKSQIVGKQSNYDWLGLSKEDSDEEQKATPSMNKERRVSFDQGSFKNENKDKKSSDWLFSSDQQQNGDKKKYDWLDKDDDNDYLGLGKEVDLDSIIKNGSESPMFGGRRDSAGVTMMESVFKGPSSREQSEPIFEKSKKLQAPAVTSDLPRKQEQPGFTSSALSDQQTVLSSGSNRTDFFTPITTKESERTDFFSIKKPVLSPTPLLSPTPEIQAQPLRAPATGPPPPSIQDLSQQQALLQQQAMLQQMMSDVQKQYKTAQSAQASSTATVPAGVSILSAPPNSLLEAEIRIRKLEVEKEYLQSLFDSSKKRYDEEIQAMESSYKGRIKLIEDTYKTREDRLQEENQLLSKQLSSKSRMIEDEKAEMMSSNSRKLQELEREKQEEIDNLKRLHRQSLEQLKADHDEILMKLKLAKDQQIETVAASHDTTKSIVAAVEMISSNARDLADLQKKVDMWNNMGLDQREIDVRSRDEQLRILQERLQRQQDETEKERQRLQELTHKLESQLQEQSRMLDEEKWKTKQEQNRLQTLQMALEEERKLWAEQQARERSNIENTRESLLQDERSLLSQLHKERQVLAEERMQFTVAQKVQKDEYDQITIKLAHAKAEFDAVMKTVSEEKNRMLERRQQNEREEEDLREKKRQLEKDVQKLRNDEQKQIEVGMLQKAKSEEIMDMHKQAQDKYQAGVEALEKAQDVEAEHEQRLRIIQNQQRLLSAKEKEIAEDRLRLSKDKKEVENLRFTLLCPNCRNPRGSSSPMIKPAPAIGHTSQAVDVPSSQISQPVYVNGHGQGTVSNGYGSVFMNNPAMQMSMNSVQTITESIKADRTIRLMKMEAVKDQQYLEEQNLFLYTLRHMPYNKNGSQDVNQNKT